MLFFCEFVKYNLSFRIGCVHRSPERQKMCESKEGRFIELVTTACCTWGILLAVVAVTALSYFALGCPVSCSIAVGLIWFWWLIS
jgi:hypothetical protein